MMSKKAIIFLLVSLIVLSGIIIIFEIYYGNIINFNNAAESSAWATWIYTIISFLMLLLSSITAYFAYTALTEWRRQIGGNYEFEIAKAGLSKLKAVEYSLKILQHGLLTENDGDDWEFKRRQNLGIALAELNDSLVGASIIWGGEIKDNLEDLNRYAHEISLASNYIFNKNGKGAIEKHYDILGYPRPYHLEQTENIENYNEYRDNLISSIERHLANIMKKYMD